MKQSLLKFKNFLVAQRCKFLLLFSYFLFVKLLRRWRRKKIKNLDERILFAYSGKVSVFLCPFFQPPAKNFRGDLKFLMYIEAIWHPTKNGDFRECIDFSEPTFFERTEYAFFEEPTFFFGLFFSVVCKRFESFVLEFFAKNDFAKMSVL